jgi:hypothetical protein
MAAIGSIYAEQLRREQRRASISPFTTRPQVLAGRGGLRDDQVDRVLTAIRQAERAPFFAANHRDVADPDMVEYLGAWIESHPRLVGSIAIIAAVFSVVCLAIGIASLL